MVLPIVEIYVMVQVADRVGVLNMIGLLLLFSIGGLWLVKHQGLGTLTRIRTELNAGRVPTASVVDGFLLLVAGVLLVIPGFVTDILGLTLLLPPVRRGVQRSLGRRFRARTTVRAWRVGPVPPPAPGPVPPGRPEIEPGRPELEP